MTMKLECDVIRDLLPLYAEKLASPASSALVEQHLAECPACRAQLEQMEKPVPVQPEPQPDAPLLGIRKTLQKKSIRIAAAAVLAVLCAFGLAFWMGGAKTPVTAEQAKIWTYNKKENEANLCVLEVQGENVRLETEGGFSWGKEYITVRAMRYTFPGLHAALT
ncbi:MAG: zf-HC2 domain-containing protein, partial [Faecalibacterium prausnitzii]|nr:zf-HC2 domain-containing protein [Faecalibacterium prausnitzii]